MWRRYGICSRIMSLAFIFLVIALQLNQNFAQNAICKLVNEKAVQSSDPRIIAIGDLHGMFASFKKILQQAGISSADDPCVWSKPSSPSARPTVLVQLGDLVDRGVESLECLRCLESLQKTVPAGSKVVRLIGNHDIWWMEGNFDYTEESTDRIKQYMALYEPAVLSGLIQATYAHPLRNQTLLFSHSGFRSLFLEHLKRTQSLTSASSISKFVNEQTVRRVTLCRQRKASQTAGVHKGCDFQEEVFQAGADRGGINIGGPFWTDFSVLVKDHSKLSSKVMPFALQVVGHTPPGFSRITRAVVGSHIRHTKNLAAVCVDGGMYMGTLSYLEIQPSGRYIAHEFVKSSQKWEERDLTELACMDQ